MIDYKALARHQALGVRKRREELLAERQRLAAEDASERQLQLLDLMIQSDGLERWWLAEGAEFMRQADERKGAAIQKEKA